jgi:hypothetical protein
MFEDFQRFKETAVDFLRLLKKQFLVTVVMDGVDEHKKERTIIDRHYNMVICSIHSFC